jgi:hypothetical protein
MRYLPLVLALMACGGGYSPAGRYSEEASDNKSESVLIIHRGGSFDLLVSRWNDSQRQQLRSDETLTGQWELIGTSGVLLSAEKIRDGTKPGFQGPWESDDTRMKLEMIGTGGDLEVTAGSYWNPTGGRFLKVSN